MYFFKFMLCVFEFLIRKQALIGLLKVIMIKKKIMRFYHSSPSSHSFFDFIYYENTISLNNNLSCLFIQVVKKKLDIFFINFIWKYCFKKFYFCFVFYIFEPIFLYSIISVVYPIKVFFSFNLHEL